MYLKPKYRPEQPCMLLQLFTASKVPYLFRLPLSRIQFRTGCLRKLGNGLGDLRQRAL